MLVNITVWGAASKNETSVLRSRHTCCNNCEICPLPAGEAAESSGQGGHTRSCPSVLSSNADHYCMTGRRNLETPLNLIDQPVGFTTDDITTVTTNLVNMEDSCDCITSCHYIVTNSEVTIENGRNSYTTAHKATKSEYDLAPVMPMPGTLAHQNLRQKSIAAFQKTTHQEHCDASSSPRPSLISDIFIGSHSPCFSSTLLRPHQRRHPRSAADLRRR